MLTGSIINGGCFIVAQATLHEAMILKDVFTKVV